MKQHSFIPTLLAGALGLSPAPALAATIFDDFNDGNDTTPAWTVIDYTQGAGTRTFGPNNNSYQLTGAAIASLRTDFPLADGEVRCEVTGWNPNVPVGYGAGILFRFSASSLSGYSFQIASYGTPYVSVDKFVNGAWMGGKGNPTRAYSSDKTYILQVIAVGAQFTCRAYEKGATENTLVDELVWTDALPGPVFTSGFTGVWALNGDFPASSAVATATFDNFFATDGQIARPVLATPTLQAGQLSSSFVREAGRPYVVEYKTDLSALSWTPLKAIEPKSLPGTEPVVSPSPGLLRAIRVKSPPFVP